MKRLSALLGAALILGSATLVWTRAQTPAPEAQQRLEQVRADLNQVKEDLAYVCCINPACNFCALVAGECPCAQNIGTDVGVCGECQLGWEAGLGHAEGVTADEVKPITGDMLKSMYAGLTKHFAPHTHEHP